LVAGQRLVTAIGKVWRAR